MSVNGQASPTVPSIAPILSFSSQSKIEDESSNNDLPIEEGFRIVKKKSNILPNQNEKNVLQETTRKLPKNVRKIFGDDEI